MVNEHDINKATNKNKIKKKSMVWWGAAAAAAVVAVVGVVVECSYAENID